MNTDPLTQLIALSLTFGVLVAGLAGVVAHVIRNRHSVPLSAERRALRSLGQLWEGKR